MATPMARSRASSKHHPSSNSSSQVRVVVRIRPFLPSEIESKDKGSAPCITVLDPEHRSGGEVTVHLKDQWTSRNECYMLDSFFGQDDDLARIFKSEVGALIPGIFQGFNATVFAYGATGSGKTYTMQGTDEQPGLIQLAMSNILSSCKSSGSSVEISYYEVYMDRCYDLLEPKAKEILVLEDKDGQVQHKGLSRVLVHTMPEFFEVFSCGVQRRKVAHTGLNDVSSRSHGVLSIVVLNGAAIGKLNLIDLAGNEDNRRTCNTGIRLLESAKINQSLFALSNVIYALNNNELRVPYRESKLTRILQDSLGGTSRALMIACLNPVSYQEAVHTVSLAARSRQIVNYVGSDPKEETPKVKVDMEAKLRAWLELKGKTKSIQRMNGPCSPFVGKTPTSVNLKKPESIRSSAKSTINDHGVFKGRKLFDSGLPVVATLDECSLSSATLDECSLSSASSGQGGPLLRDGSTLNEVKSLCEVDVSKERNDPIKEDCSCISRNDGCREREEPPQDTCSTEIYSEGQQDAMVDNYSCISIDENSKDCKSDLDGNNQLEPSKNISLHIADDENEKEGMGATTDINYLKPSTYLPDSSFNKENPYTPYNKLPVSPPISEKIWQLQNSLRKVLSPVHSNMTPHQNLSSDDRLCFILLEPKTPKTPYMEAGTPLDKFNELSSRLKDSLVQEYLAFLNTASKEELLALKGIGQKRAEYILQLREETPQPLKSLSDLEKIGLTSKQVHNMFGRAARGIFA